MLIFASDTSLDSASCALIKNNKVIQEVVVNNNKRHAVNFMPMVESFFNESKYSVKDVDLFAVSSGPGSFTGLRIGLASIKAMAFALQKKMIMVPTLDVLAFQSKKENYMMCPVIDARNNQVYTALYRDEKITEYMGIPIEELAELLNTYQGDIVLSGDAAKMHLPYLEEKTGKHVLFNEEHVYPLASACGLIALNYDKIEASEAVPFYLRPSQAERLFNK